MLLRKISKFILINISFIFLSGMFWAQDNQAVVKNQREILVDYAKTFLGVPYLFGGTTTAGMDCSGFINTAVLESLKITLPRTSAQLFSETTIIAEKDRQPGDIVFFRTVENSISHSGIYLGKNLFIHSASEGPKTGVIISSLTESYWSRTYIATRRFLPPDETYSEEYIPVQANPQEEVTTQKATNKKAKQFVIELGGSYAWNLYDIGGPAFNTVGGNILSHVVYRGWMVQPGLGVDVRISSLTNAIQIPFIFSVTLPPGFIRFYTGLVFTFGEPHIPKTSTVIKAPIYPGLFGITFLIPPIKVQNLEIVFFQDISYTVYGGSFQSSVDFVNAITTGLVFSTGLKFIIPIEKKK